MEDEVLEQMNKSAEARERLERMLHQISEEVRIEGEEENVLSVMHEIADSGKVVTLISKNHKLEFTSEVKVKGRYALVLKPQHLNKPLSVGSILFLEYNERMEGGEYHDYLIALKVIKTNIPVDAFSSAVICEIPREFVISRTHQRLGRRYYVGDQTGFWLKFPKSKAKFRILDFSRTGLRFAIVPPQRRFFPPNKLFNYVSFQVGELEINAVFLRVREASDDHVSCRIGFDWECARKMDQILKSMSQAEARDSFQETEASHEPPSEATENQP